MPDDMQAVRAALRAECAAVLSVVQAALCIDGLIFTAPRPARHGDLFYKSGRRAQPDEQGFLLSDGSFAARERAWDVAIAAGQPILRDPEVKAANYLFSEDLW